MNDAIPIKIASLTIANASDARARFLEATGSFASVTIAADAIETIDLAGLQLLVSLFRHARATGKKAALKGALREGVREKILLAGLCEGPCETGEQLSEACAAC